MKARGVWELSTPRLRDLHAVLGRAGQAPCTEIQLQGAGFDGSAVAMLIGMPVDHAGALVAAVLFLSFARTSGIRTTAQILVNGYFTGEPFSIDLFPPPRPSPIYDLVLEKTRDADAALDVQVDARALPEDAVFASGRRHGRALRRARSARRRRRRSGCRCGSRGARPRSAAAGWCSAMLRSELPAWPQVEAYEPLGGTARRACP